MYMTEIGRLFLAAKGFNINLVHFLLLCYVIISNLYICFFTGTISHVYGRALKTVLCA